MKKLDLVEDMPVCTDATTRPYLVEARARVLDQPSYASRNIAQPGLLASVCLACRFILNHSHGVSRRDA